MNGQYSSSDFVERTDSELNNPAVNPEPFADRVPVDQTLIPEMPLEGTVAAVSPLNETIPSKAPFGQTIAEGSHVNPSIPYQAPMVETGSHIAATSVNAGSPAALLSREEAEHFRTRWSEIQGNFVDEPRSAVEQADALVSEMVEKITQVFANEHSSLVGQWNQGNDVSTEDLRKALQRYRSFFNRLVV